MIRITLLFMVFTLQFQSVIAQALQGTKKGDLESNISVLNLFGEKPEGIQNMYRSAYNILSAKREATFMDVSKNEDFQSFCEKNGITHFGGPLLGTLTFDGAKMKTALALQFHLGWSS